VSLMRANYALNLTSAARARLAARGLVGRARRLTLLR
jgi:hypothetical protein